MKGLAEKLIKKLSSLNGSYSQEGEDLILLRAFNYRPSGFYVDVGAHHPKRFSNTFAFYQRGWRGINIDPLIGFSNRFSIVRPLDQNLPIGVSGSPGALEYYEFNDAALNTFSAEKRDRVLAANEGYHLVRNSSVATIPLREILERHLPAGQVIDFLTVDVEGLDLEVLKSNDWARFRPEFVVFEDHNIVYECKPIGDRAVGLTIESACSRLLLDNGYTFFAKTVSTWIFRNSRPA